MHLMSFYAAPYMSKQREASLLKKLPLVRCVWFAAGISLGVALTYVLVREGQETVIASATAPIAVSVMADGSQEMSMEDAIRATMTPAPLTENAVDATAASPVVTADVAADASVKHASVQSVSWPQIHEITVSSGDTLFNILVRHGIEKVTAHRLCKEINKTYNLRQLRPGAQMTLVLDQDTSKPAASESELMFPTLLSKLTMIVSKVDQVEVTPRGGDAYDVKLTKKKLITGHARAKAIIHSSLYGAAEQQGVPREAISQLIKNFSYAVDFQRDIKSGDVMDVMYETKKTEEGDVVESGDVVYAMLKTDGRTHTQYRFLNEHGLPSYYNEKGESIVKRLLRTPIDGARLSSGFGMRRHPILGYSKMHTGIDFAAARGTPIFASGDGVVTFAGYNGSYGKYVRIKHNNEFSTAYAHAHRIAPAVRKGTFVRQGQVIAYVGTTGRSTGPHLHYEIIKDGRAVNPVMIKMTGSDRLQGERLIAFKKHVHAVQTQLARLGNEKKLAALR
jgi:murein DD-endopeptidase MepM/ murein hydrolase activator NlpD